MTANRTYYPLTTSQQRKKIFERWEQSQNITAVCRKAHVGRGTFYKWKACFLKAGSAGLESYAKLGTPVGTGLVVAEIQSKVLDEERKEKKFVHRPVSRTADMPGQTMNVDLLFVPADHRADVKLPAVSGSSGHLVVERLEESGQEPDYPGKVFANVELNYVEVMQAFVEASQPLSGPRKVTETVVKTYPGSVEIRQLRRKEAEYDLTNVSSQ